MSHQLLNGLTSDMCASRTSTHLIDHICNLLIARFQSLPLLRLWIRQNHTILYLWMLQKKTFVRKCSVLCQWAAKTILRLSIQLMKIAVSILECQPVVHLHFVIPLHWQGRIAVVATLPIGKFCCYNEQIIRSTPKGKIVSLDQWHFIRVSIGQLAFVVLQLM